MTTTNNARTKKTYYALVGADSYIAFKFLSSISESLLTKAGWILTRPTGKVKVGGNSKLSILRAGAAQLFRVGYTRPGNKVGSVSMLVPNANADTFAGQAIGDTYQAGREVISVAPAVQTRVSVG